jgi:hypothetical protein
MECLWIEVEINALSKRKDFQVNSLEKFGLSPNVTGNSKGDRKGKHSFFVLVKTTVEQRLVFANKWDENEIPVAK